MIDPINGPSKEWTEAERLEMIASIAEKLRHKDENVLGYLDNHLMMIVFLAKAPSTFLEDNRSNFTPKMRKRTP